MDLKLDIREEEEYILNFTCSTNFPVKYPRWKINDTEFEVTKLPKNIVARGMSLEFKLETSSSVCCFLKTYVNGAVDNIYSNTVTVVNTRNGL